MQEPIVTYRQASILKELGFDLKTKHYYNILDETLYLAENEEMLPCDFNATDIYISAPSISLTLAWLRIEQKMACGVFPAASENKKNTIGYNWRYYMKDEDDFSVCYESNTLNPFPNYQLAESDLLSKVLESLTKRN